MERSAVDSLLRTSQAHCQQICDKQTLDFGIAFYSGRFSSVPQANQFREVWIDDPARIADAFDEAETWFNSKGLRCHRWAPAGGEASEALTEFLMRRGFSIRRDTAMILSNWPEMDGDEKDTVRVLPARAMRAAFRTIIDKANTSTSEPDSTQAIEAMEERLDDAPYDMFVAMDDGRPAGCCALYQVGDIARVTDLIVHEDDAAERIAKSLLKSVLVLARRLAIKNIVTQVSEQDKVRSALFDQMGFKADGTLTEFERAATE